MIKTLQMCVVLAVSAAVGMEDLSNFGVGHNADGKPAEEHFEGHAEDPEHKAVAEKNIKHQNAEHFEILGVMHASVGSGMKNPKVHPRRSADHSCPKGQHHLAFGCVDGSHGPRDGKLDESELAYRAHIYLHQKAIDSNHDGRVSAREAARFRKHHLKKEIQQAEAIARADRGEDVEPDTNHEGHKFPHGYHHVDRIHDHLHHHSYPTESEITSAGKADLLHYDMDRDGHLNSGEYANLQQRDAQHREDTLHQHHQWALEHVRDKHTLKRDADEADAANEKGQKHQKHTRGTHSDL